MSSAPCSLPAGAIRAVIFTRSREGWGGRDGRGGGPGGAAERRRTTTADGERNNVQGSETTPRCLSTVGSNTSVPDRALTTVSDSVILIRRARRRSGSSARARRASRTSRTSPELSRSVLGEGVCWPGETTPRLPASFDFERCVPRQGRVPRAVSPSSLPQKVAPLVSPLAARGRAVRGTESLPRPPRLPWFRPAIKRLLNGGLAWALFLAW
jgi:hypothetical protein